MSCWRSASAPRRRRLPSNSPPASAVIAAAGSGERLGAGGPKAFVELAGRPLLDWSLDAFERAESVGPIVVAVPSDHDGPVRHGVIAVAGGATRSESVAAGLERVDTELVAVHDAARPLVTAQLIDELVAKISGRPDAAGVIAAAALTDTVKRAGEARATRGESPQGGPTVAQTMSREHLWAAQTPQVFRTDALRAALDTDPQRIAAATDDAMLVERAEGRVLIHPWSAENLKVTIPLDLRIAELVLAERGRRPGG
jgi:2-C-methyl-D-erythritol 4-phosphate cytidylyltransferase